MKRKSIMMALVFCFIGALCFAADVNLGTWKLNEAKSKLGAGAPKNITVIYTADGDNVKVTTDGVDPSGKPTHTEWTGKYDGKDYPVTGDTNSDARAYSKVNDNTLHVLDKKGGKTLMEVHIVVAPDGKSRTVTFNGTDASGKKVTSSAVYDKQ
ncbi:MAG TPA: hypothetical protein VLH08_02620 [Acidobacteriota bacterium]|nr:hypothetical protein [Acidobacteriota bacterium]